MTGDVCDEKDCQILVVYEDGALCMRHVRRCGCKSDNLMILNHLRTPNKDKQEQVSRVEVFHLLSFPANTLSHSHRMPEVNLGGRV